MKISISSDEFPIQIIFEGSFLESDIYWKIIPLEKRLKNFDETFYQSLYNIKQWAKVNKIKLQIKAHLLFKTAFFFFSKSIEQA